MPKPRKVTGSNPEINAVELTENAVELTEAEWEIMKVVWEKEPCAAGTVQETLTESRDRAYSTVKTTMDRMVDKGFLQIERIRNLQLFKSCISEVDAKRGEFRFANSQTRQKRKRPTVNKSSNILEGQKMNQVFNTCITGLNNIGQGFWNYASGVFIQASVLIILLLILDFMLRKRVRAVFRYCLWMLLFVKLVLPASFTLPTGIGYWLGDYFPGDISVAKLMPEIEEAVPLVIDIPQWYLLETPPMNETATTGVELESISWQGLVFSGWLVGMLVLLTLLVRRICFVRELIAQSRPANERSLEMLQECCCRIGIRRNIELRLTGNTLSPAVCGLFKPIILIPAAMLKKLSRDKLKAVLIHELAHIKRGDIWINLLQTMLQIVYFYNPLVWLANAMIRRTREQAVDEMVLN